MKRRKSSRSSKWQIGFAERGLLLAATVTLCGPALADEPVAHNGPASGPVWSVRVSYATADDILRLSRIVEHLRLDEPHRVAVMEVGTATVEAIRAIGLGVEIDQQASEKIQRFRASRLEYLRTQEPNPPRNAPLPAPLAPRDPNLPQALEDGQATCYRTMDKANADIDALAAQYPNLIRVQPIGPTWIQQQQLSFREWLRAYLPAQILQRMDLDRIPEDRGVPLRAVIVGNRAVQSKPVARMVTTAALHAREYIPAELATRFAEWLVNGYGSDPTATWLLDKNEFHFILHANPDGRRLAEQIVPQDEGTGWRKNANFQDALCAPVTAPADAVTGTPGHAVNAMASGVDLNRNFPFGWHSANGQSASDNPCDGDYRGKAAMSEPETQAIMRYIAGVRQADGNFADGVLPDQRKANDGDYVTSAGNDYVGLYLDLHGFSQLVLWPWGMQPQALSGQSRTSNDFAMSALGQRLAWYNGYRATQRIYYGTEGTAIDTIYGELGTPSFTLELGQSFYEPCEAFEQDTLPRNLAALRYAARILWAPYKLALGPDVAQLQLSAPRAIQGESVTVSAIVDDGRYRYDAGFSDNPTVTRHEPEPIASAYAYVDRLPWESGGQKAIGMRAQDGGVFDDAATLNVSAVIDTTHLAPGKHLVYVQGINKKGHRGAVDAVFLEVLAKPAPEEGGAGAIGWQAAMALFGLGLTCAGWHQKTSRRR